jgi:hypothetical protein
MLTEQLRAGRLNDRETCVVWRIGTAALCVLGAAFYMYGVDRRERLHTTAPTAGAEPGRLVERRWQP